MIGPILHLYIGSAASGGGDVLFTGTASGTASAGGSLAGSRGLNGQVSGASVAASGLSSERGLAGQSSGQGGGTGGLTVESPGAVLLNGTASGATVTGGTFVTIRGLSGASNGIASASLYWERGGQPGGFVPDWAIRKFWNRVQKRVRKDVRKPKRLKRQGARIRYAEQVADKAREVAAEIGNRDGVNLSPLPGIVYDMMLADVTAIEREMARLDAIVIAREAERRLQMENDEALVLLLSEVF